MTQSHSYAPAFSIKIKGTELHHEVRADVLSVKVTDAINKPGSFSFTIRDKPKEQGRFAGGPKLIWMDSGLFDEGNKVQIELGYVENSAKFRFMGEITAMTPTFPDTGLPTLQVRGFSFFQRLQRQHWRGFFEKVKDSDIAAKVAKAVQLKIDADATEIEYPLVSVQGQDYATFLLARAQRIGYELYVQGDVLCFKEPTYITNPSPDLTLEWGQSLRSFNPSLSTYGMVTEVTVRGVQTSQGKEKKPLVGKAAAGQQERGKMGAKSGPEIAKNVFGEKSVLADNHDVISQQEADLLARAKLEATALNFISGRGSCIGQPELKARTVIALEGLGQRFSGHYYVTSTTHTIDAGGYRTDFEVKRNARNESR